jgi:ABC-type phosphate transport system substrate-binding protein
MSTRRSVLLSAVILTFATLGPLATSHAGSRIKVIVNPSVSGERITRSQLTAVFLRETTRWGNGMPIQAVDQSTQSPTRAAFSNDVLARPIAAVQIHWVRQLSNGGGKPPVVKESDAEVLEFVRTTPGAIGYLSESFPTDAGVRVVPVAE